jgi:hypothetical protein
MNFKLNTFIFFVFLQIENTFGIKIKTIFTKEKKMKNFLPGACLLLYFWAPAKAQQLQISSDAGLRHINYVYDDSRLSRSTIPYIYYGINVHCRIDEKLWLGVGIHSLPTTINVNIIPLVNANPYFTYDLSPIRSPEFSLSGRYQLFDVSKRLSSEAGLGLSLSQTKYFGKIRNGSNERRYIIGGHEFHYQIYQLARYNIFIKPEVSLIYQLSSKIDVGFTFQNLIGIRRKMRSDVQYMDNDDGNWHHATIRTNGGGRHYNVRLIYNIFYQGKKS